MSSMLWREGYNHLTRSCDKLASSHSINKLNRLWVGLNIKFCCKLVTELVWSKQFHAFWPYVKHCHLTASRLAEMQLLSPLFLPYLYFLIRRGSLSYSQLIPLAVVLLQQVEETWKYCLLLIYWLLYYVQCYRCPTLARVELVLITKIIICLNYQIL